MSIGDFFITLGNQSQATREAMQAAPVENLTFRYDTVRGSCFGAYAPDKITDEAVRKLAGLEQLPWDPCGEEDKGYRYFVGFRCVEDPARSVALYDRWGTWRMSGDAETLAAFERWAAARLEV